MDPEGSWTYPYNSISEDSTQSSKVHSSSDLHETDGLNVGSNNNPSVLLETVSTTIGTTTEGYNTSSDFISSSAVEYEPAYSAICYKSGTNKSINYNNTPSQQFTTAHSRSNIISKEGSRGEHYVTFQIPATGTDTSPNTYFVEQPVIDNVAQKSVLTSISNQVNSVWPHKRIENYTNDNTISVEILPSQENIIHEDMSGIAQNTARSHGNTRTQVITYEQLNNSQFANINPENPNHTESTKTILSSRDTLATKTSSQQPISSSVVSLPLGTISSSNQYYRSPITITPYTDNSVSGSNTFTTSKPYSAISSSNLNPGCILVTTSPASPIGGTSQTTGNSKEYRPYTCAKSHGKSVNYANISSRASIEKVIHRNPTNDAPHVGLVSNLTNNSNNNYGIPATMSVASSKQSHQAAQVVQTKAQTKIYPEVVVLGEYDRTKLGDIQQGEGQDNSIGYCTIIDGRLYAAGGANIILNEGGKCNRTNVGAQQVTRHFVVSNNSEFINAENNNRGKVSNSEQQYTGAILQNDGTNTIIVPRRSSPSHSSQVPSPAYPVQYSNAINTIESPQQGITNHNTTDTPSHIVIYKTNASPQTTISHSNLDTSVTRNSNNLTSNNSVVYSSVITRALVNDENKLYTTSQQYWDGNEKTKKYYTLKSADHNEVIVPADIQIKQTFYEPSTHNTHLGALTNIKNENQVTENILVTTDHPLISQIELATPKLDDEQNISVPIPIATPVVVQQTPVKQGRRKKNQNNNKTREQLLSENEFLINRGPSTTHNLNTTEQVINMQTQSAQEHENGGTFFDFGKWNTNSTASVKPILCSPVLLNAEQNVSIVAAQTGGYPNTSVTTRPSSSVDHSSQTGSFYQTIHVANPPTSYASINEIPVSNQTNVNTKSQVIDSSNEQVNSSVSPLTNVQQNSVSTVSIGEQTLKIIVPDIEQELEFLSESKDYAKSPAVQINKILVQKNDKFPPKSGTGTGTNFMASYLKFLQGERESPPPAINRVSRKTSWQKTTPTNSANTKQPLMISTSTTQTPSVSQTTSVLQNHSIQAESNDSNKTENDKMPTSVPSVPTKPVSADVCNDKNEQKRKLNESDTGPKKSRYRSKKQEAMNDTKILTSPLPKKARPQMAMQMHSMANETNAQETMPTAKPVESLESSSSTSNVETITSAIKTNQNLQPNQPPHTQLHQAIKDPSTSQAESSCQYQQQKNEDPLNMLPRRETSKYKTRVEEQDFADSNSDPVGKPKGRNLNPLEEKKQPKRKARKQTKSTAQPKCNKSNLTVAVKDTGIEETVASLKAVKPRDTKKRATDAAKAVTPPINPFKLGDFVVIRTDLVDDWPPIWQVDGKAVLRKFEAVCQNGKTCYKSLSTYAALTIDSRKLYVKAPVKIISSSQTETIVELMRSQLLTEDSELFIQKTIQDFALYRDNFDIYLQTLISHSLDSNFFDEIMLEQDAYFLPHIKIIDDIRENCKRKLLAAAPSIQIIIEFIETWPNCNVITDLKPNSQNIVLCQVCQNLQATNQIVLFGPMYDKATLQILPPTDGNNEEELMLCATCVPPVRTYHKLDHEKYRLFYECSTKVNERHNEDPSKPLTQVLKDLLADATWVEQLFYSMRYTWAEVHDLERQIRLTEHVQK